ncbi:MAG: DNA adenine methylase [Candidatus Sericytochromatia bacterium]
MINKNKLVTPFLKWVGGKRQLINEIDKLKPRFTYYYEPFLGGGAVLFNLQPKNAVVSDLNEELINVYNVIKDNSEELINDLKKHKNESEYFYKIRALDRESNFKNLSNVEKASRFIYLNKTCYNGLYRVNNSGEFNSPFGKYVNPNIVNEITIKAVSNYLNTNKISIYNKDYYEILKEIKKDSFVYFDPPYQPVSKTSNFTGYIQGGFNIDEQIRLKNCCDELNKKNIKFMLSNSDSEIIKDLYKDYNIHYVKANRFINSNSEKRGEINEVIITNYE